VLFSQERVADFLNRTFEPVWESVRPVPVVRIDFGDGRVLTRTLHGNILTSVCTSDGLVVDALPGIYTASTYVARLQQLRRIAQYAQTLAADRRAVWVHSYHEGQVDALKKNASPAVVGTDLIAPYITKGRIERPVQLVLTNPGPANHNASAGTAPAKAVLTQAEDVSQWQTLEEDTRLNERTRRRQIHELLARTGLVAPDQVTRPIYKDVLHADLDDPYLGLGEVLFRNYPFAREDATP
jgi:hypothetical protein